MLVVEPYGIRDADSYTRKKTGESIHDYKGPGFAFISATMEGPIIEEFPSRGHKLIFRNLLRREIEPGNPKDKEKSWYTPKFEIISEDESADAAKAIKRLAAYAFRRAVTDEDLAPYLGFSKRSVRRRKVSKVPCGRSSPPCSLPPHFLYLREMPGRLDDLALANRLSLFLNRTLPERELLSLAFQSKLTNNPAALRKETERLLKHGRFDRSDRFHGVLAGLAGHGLHRARQKTVSRVRSGTAKVHGGRNRGVPA